MAVPIWLDENGNVVTPEDFGTSVDDTSVSVGNVAINPELVTVTGGLKGSQGKFIIPCILLSSTAGKDILDGIAYQRLVISLAAGSSGNPVGLDTGTIYIVVSMFIGEEEVAFSPEVSKDSGGSIIAEVLFNTVIPANPTATKFRIYFSETPNVVTPGQECNYLEYTIGQIIAFGYVIGINSFGSKFIPAKYEIRTFDYEDFDTEEDCSYYYHQEDLMPGRQITVTRVRIVYRDLGQFTLKATILTAQQQVEEIVTSANPRNWQVRTLGGKSDKKLYTDYFDIIITGERPQLILSREANSGPLAIISSSIITDVELMEQV